MRRNIVVFLVGLVGWFIVSFAPVVLVGGWGFMIWTPLNEPLASFVQEHIAAINSAYWVSILITSLNGVVYAGMLTAAVHFTLVLVRRARAPGKSTDR